MPSPAEYAARAIAIIEACYMGNPQAISRIRGAALSPDLGDALALLVDEIGEARGELEQEADRAADEESDFPPDYAYADECIADANRLLALESEIEAALAALEAEQERARIEAALRSAEWQTPAGQRLAREAASKREAS